MAPVVGQSHRPQCERRLPGRQSQTTAGCDPKNRPQCGGSGRQRLAPPLLIERSWGLTGAAAVTTRHREPSASIPASPHQVFAFVHNHFAVLIAHEPIVDAAASGYPSNRTRLGPGRRFPHPPERQHSRYSAVGNGRGAAPSSDWLLHDEHPYHTRERGVAPPSLC